MNFEEKAKIRMEHWLKHTADHLREYEQFANELEDTGKKEIAQHIREMAVMTARSTECLDRALISLMKVP